MSRRDGSCWRHPAQRAAGVCADCLKERLNALSPPPEPHPSSIARASALGFVAVDPKKKRLASEHQLLHQQRALSEAHLRRSKSWSHWEAGAGAGAAGASNHAWAQNSNGFARKSDAVLDDWTRQRFFSIFARDQSSQQQNQKRKDSSSGSHLRGGASEFRKSASGGERVERPAAAWQPHVEARGYINSSRVTILENDDCDERFNRCSNEAPGSEKKSKPSTWWASLLHLALFRKPKPGEKKKQKASSLAGYFNKASRKEQEKKKLADPSPPPPSAKHNNKHFDNPGGSNWISSPLRIFKGHNHGQKRGNCSNNRELPAEQSQQDQERNSWSIPSSTELRRLHPGSGYTAYYRDYGAWSLSSSPLPNHRWGNGAANRGKQPWETRDHSSSSPYHHHSSTWNFYLTPLRPVKTTGAGGSSSGASKHRK